MQDGLEGSRERERRRDYLITGLDADGVQRSVDGRGAGVEQHRVCDAQTRCPFAFQTGCLETIDSGQLTSVQDLEYGCFVLGTDVWPPTLQILCNRRSTTMDRQCVIHRAHLYKKR